MLYPHIGHYRSKTGMLHIPAIAGAFLPCPTDAHGSPVWITGRTSSAIAIITAVSPDGRTVTVTGPAGWSATVDHRQVQFLGPTPYREWIVAQTAHLTFARQAQTAPAHPPTRSPSIPTPSPGAATLPSSAPWCMRWCTSCQEVAGKPGRGRYHNQEWAHKMTEVGLHPFNVDHPERATGDRCSHEIVPGAAFDRACATLLAGGSLIAWEGTGGEAGADADGGGDGEGEEPPGKRRSKTKYSCPCGQNVWGKPGMALVCGDCGDEFLAKDRAAKL